MFLVCAEEEEGAVGVLCSVLHIVNRIKQIFFLLSLRWTDVSSLSDVIGGFVLYVWLNKQQMFIAAESTFTVGNVLQF